MRGRNRKGSMLQRAVAGTGIAAVMLGATVWPAATATATSAVDKTSICQAYQAEEAKQTKANAKLTKLLETGKWAAGKKALLSTAAAESNFEKQFAGVYLKGAPRTVRAAAAVILTFDDTLRNVIEKAKSLAQYDKGITAAEAAPKVQAALQVLDTYTTKLCSSTTSST
jgi:hypothetical protein